MANDLNMHQCIGRLGADPEIRYLDNGTAVASLSVACTAKWKDKQSGQMQERTEWIRYSAFGKLAEIMGEYLRKGSKVYLSGQLRTRKYQAQDGTDRYTTEIIADQMQMLDSRNDGGSGAQAYNNQSSGAQNQQQAPQQQGGYIKPQPQQPQPQPQQGGMDQFEDDIPF